MPDIIDSVSTIDAYEAQTNSAFYDFASVSNADTSTLVRAHAISPSQMFGSNSTLKTSEIIVPQSQKQYVGNGVGWAAALGLMIYLVVLISVKSYFGRIFYVLVGTGKANENKRSLFQNFMPSANMLVIFSVLSLSIFIFLIANCLKSEYTQQYPTALLLIFITAGLYVYVYFKKISLFFIGYISENKQLTWRLMANEISIFGSYGLFTVPFLILGFLLAKSEVNIWLIVAAVVVALLFVFKNFRIFMIFIREKISPFFLILYLCAFEILPIWLIVDFFTHT